ncbi:interaptin-like isoform X2 [Dysidea avara]|uniref:interaptin-like isoform X2 n=1 Tax=Dysidea avara TaxID=196820 RepID=UPI0033194873
MDISAISLRTKRPKTPTFATIKEDPVSSSDVDKYDAETESSEEDEPDLHFGRQHELPRPTSTMSLYHDNHARRSPSPGGRSRTISQNSLPVNLSDERISRKYMELSLQPYEIPMIAQYFNRQVLSRSNSESINIALINLQKEKDKLQNEKTTLLEDKVKLLEDKTKLVEDLSKLQQENAAFQKLYKELNVQQQELSNRNDELVNAIEQVKAQLRDSQCLNIEKENALTDSEERNITLLQDNDDLQVSVKEFEVKYLQLSTSFDQVKKQLEDTKQKLTHAYTNKKIEELEASLKESQNKLEKANEDCVAMMQAKEVEQLKLHEKLEATQMTVSDLKQRNEELQKFLEISQNDLEKTKEKDEFNKQSMADELDNLKHSNTTIQGLLETTQKELEKTKDNAESNKQSMSHEIDELKHSNATIKGLLETTQKDLNETTLQGKIKQQSMSDEIEELKQSNVKLQDRANVPKVTSGLHSQSKGKSLAPASFNIHVTVRRLDALKQSQKENELKIQKQFVEINSVKSENAKLEKQCSEYQKKISYLTVQLQTEKQRKTYHREPQEEEIEIQSAVKNTVQKNCYTQVYTVCIIQLYMWYTQTCMNMIYLLCISCV